MFIKALGGRPLTALIAYSMELQKQPVQSHFANNFRQARNQIQKISAQFNIPKEHSRRFFNFYPRVFKPHSKQFLEFKERVGWVKELSATETDKHIGSALEKLMFSSNYLLFTVNKEQFSGLVQAIRSNFASQKQIETIFGEVPNLINAKFPSILSEKLVLLQDYLSLNKDQAMGVFEATPFLLAASTRKLRESILVLHQNYGLSKQQIVEQMKVMPEIFLLGGPILRDVFKTPINWGLGQEEARGIFLRNPLLFFNYPYDVMPHKRRILRFLNFTSEMGRIILRQFPQILVWSIRSLQQKALFITNRLDLKLDNSTVELLVFNFNKTLRPRGQMLVRSKTPYDNQNIVGLMKMTNEEFAERTKVPLEKLNEQIAKFPVSMEMDFKKSNLLTKIGAKQKFIKLAQAYDH